MLPALPSWLAWLALLLALGRQGSKGCLHLPWACLGAVVRRKELPNTGAARSEGCLATAGRDGGQGVGYYDVRRLNSPVRCEKRLVYVGVSACNKSNCSWEEALPALANTRKLPS